MPKSILSSLKRFQQVRPNLSLSLVFVVLASFCLPLLDLEIQSPDPWAELGRIGRALLAPRWDDWHSLISALLSTFAFAFCAVMVALVAGTALALLYQRWPVRVLCAATRAVHEIFWGLIFMQVFGLSATTGVLAIAVPYSGIFARVFADIFARQSKLARQTLSNGKSVLSHWLYTTLPQGWQELRSYTRYRFECALRSSAILGFIGLPTLGFYFESAFKQGNYAEASCLLWVFFLLIASLRWILYWRLLPVYAIASVFLLPESPPVSASFLWQFVTHDIWPTTLREGDITAAFGWYATQTADVILPASVYTIALSLATVVFTGVLVLLVFPLASRVCVGRFAIAGHGLLIFLRSTPEMLLAFVFLLLFGPSALPALFALAIHNSGLIGYLAARDADQLTLRPDHARAANLWAYELVPRLFPRISALLLYRWEVIMRESAILGILGISTLGFYVDSAFAEIRFDKAFLLIIATALLNIFVDLIGQWINRSVRVEALPLVVGLPSKPPESSGSNGGMQPAS